LPVRVPALTGSGLDFGDAIVDGARAMVPRLGELVAATAVRATVRELIALAERVYYGQLTAVMASHGELGR